MRLISIIIPHYQKQEALEKTWEELRLQLHPDDEIIIVDDHSPDGVPEFNCKCTRVIRPPKLETHIYRLCTTRNYGLQHAKHDACIILDPDCIPDPRFIDYARRLYDPSILYSGCIDKQDKHGVIQPDKRRRQDKNYWCDYRDKGGGCIWGGMMMFSKSRTRLLGWFDTDFNGAWGAEESEFSSKCYHSGMRLRYSMQLRTVHQWHEKKNFGFERNLKLYKDKIRLHPNNLNKVTPYQPDTGVMVITMMRPDLINQCLQGIFRNRTQLKVRLINNGDHEEDTRRICEQWGRRWAVDYVYHERKWPAQVRNDSMRWARENGFKYLIFVDDDMLVNQNGLTSLVKTMDENPEYYSVAGSLRKIKHGETRDQTVGGKLFEDAFWDYPRRKGLYEADWVGGGFTIHKLTPAVPYDEEYQTGYNDFDWSMTCRSKGLKLGVTGDAHAHHGYKLTRNGYEQYINPSNYNSIRYDSERHKRMMKQFTQKWGFSIGKGGLWKGKL